MMATGGALDVERFRGWIVRALGLQFDDTRAGFLADVLRRRLDATGEGVAEYLRQLETRASSQEVAALIQELTVSETYFFRHAEQYRAFAEVALPDRLRASAGVPMSVVSAGCATGEEPYSLAMTIRDVIGERARAVTILGVDINPSVIQRATRARFSAWALRETPQDAQRRWFATEGREFALDDGIRRAVRFEAGNLTDEHAPIWRPQAHDVVFCRNVLMYFAPAVAQAVVGRLARSLRPGGYLFLGHAETLRGLSTDFHLCHTHGTFYYQRKAAGDLVAAVDLSTAADATVPPSPLVTLVDGGATWLEAIQQSSERLRTLAETPEQTGASRAGTSWVRPVREIALALELLREERFTDALAIVAALPPEAARQREIVLLRAVLLTHGGRLAEAEAECERLLTLDELSAEAHYLLALCREGAGDAPGALYHDQVAIYLDPGFAMAHLHLGLLARRTQDVSTARRELEQAIALIEREDASRVLLFGGGFSREALVVLCRAELARVGAVA